MNVNRRRRRTAAEAKAMVLDTAAHRLQELGLQGLNIVGVAQQAGISHATLIHHFGSSAGMRRALVEHMTARLVRDAVATLANHESLDGLFRELFSVFSTGGHAKLLAWLAMEEGHREPPSASMRAMFADLMAACVEQLSERDVAVARNLITLVVTSAIGLGVAGAELTDLVGMDEAAGEAFPRWLAQWIDASQLS